MGLEWAAFIKKCYVANASKLSIKDLGFKTKPPDSKLPTLSAANLRLPFKVTCIRNAIFAA